MKLFSTLLTLLCGAALAADYDATTQTISNDFFVMNLVNTASWNSTVDLDGVVAASMASIDYWGGLLETNYSLAASNRITFTLDFDTLGGNTLGVASSSLQLYGGSTSGNSAASYTPFTNESNGLSYNVLYRSEAKLLHNKTLTEGNDFTIKFNSTKDFYYGTGTDIGTKKSDFYSVLLHEITHGMGFGSTLFDGTVDSGLILGQRGDVTDENNNPVYNITSFDTMILQNLPGNDPTELTLGATVALGDPSNGINIHNPATYAPGSSISHISDESDPNALMNFALTVGNIKRELSDQEIFFLQEMGYSGLTSAGIPEPSSAVLILILIPAAAMRRRRRHADAA